MIGLSFAPTADARYLRVCTVAGDPAHVGWSAAVSRLGDVGDEHSLAVLAGLTLADEADVARDGARTAIAGRLAAEEAPAAGARVLGLLGRVARAETLGDARAPATRASLQNSRSRRARANRTCGPRWRRCATRPVAADDPSGRTRGRARAARARGGGDGALTAEGVARRGRGDVPAVAGAGPRDRQPGLAAWTAASIRRWAASSALTRANMRSAVTGFVR